MADERYYRVTLRDHDGTSYVVTGRAATPKEAVALAQETIDYLNRIGPIDAVPEVVEIDAAEAGSGFGFAMTTPDGRTIRK